jgi:hypothetical protein
MPGISDVAGLIYALKLMNTFYKAVYLYFRPTQHTLNILFYTQATCFDLKEVIIRPFKNIKTKITVLACTWDPSVTCVAETVFSQIGNLGSLILFSNLINP